jgi:hypothetical protein
MYIFDHLIVDHFQHLLCCVFAVFYQAQLESRNEAGNKHFLGGLAWSSLVTFSLAIAVFCRSPVARTLEFDETKYIKSIYVEDCTKIVEVKATFFWYVSYHELIQENIITSSNSSWFPCHVPGAESMETGCRAEPDITTGDTGPGILRLRPLRWPETPPAAVWYLTILYPSVPDDTWRFLMMWHFELKWPLDICLPSWGPEKRAVSRGRQVSVSICFNELLDSRAQQNRTEHALLYLANIVQRYNYKK